MTPINLIHDLLSPADRIGDGAHRGRNPCSAVVLRELSCREDAGGDQQHALATLVHLGSLALSPCIRHRNGSILESKQSSAEICGRFTER